MATQAGRFKQEMPPPGGYSPLDWAQKPTRHINIRKLWAWFAGVTIVSNILYQMERNLRRKWYVEHKDCQAALAPLIRAEEDRIKLRQVVKNRDIEHELMKNVPGWVTGTYFGEPVFPRVRNQFPPITMEEFFAHNHQERAFFLVTDRCWRS